MIQANLGLAPWDALNMGMSYVTGMSYGDAGVAVGLVILIADILLREKIGFGTILNTLLISKLVDVFYFFDLLPKAQSFGLGLVFLISGQVILCFGTYFYISPAMGCGPRDSLMVALSRRLKKFPIGLIRGTLEGIALVTGWLMGAKVGIGTLISVLCIGFILQGTFALMRFDPKSVWHESCFVTVGRLRSRKAV